MHGKIVSIKREFDGQIILNLEGDRDVYLPVYDSQRIMKLTELIGATYNNQKCDCCHDGIPCLCEFAAS